MSTPNMTESFVDVSVDPDEAFHIFTDEMDLWWVRSPISFYDSARAVEKRCERGVGGRIMEIYHESRGDLRVIGVICTWEPGKGVSWDTAHDDVHIDVLFERIATGTRISRRRDATRGRTRCRRHLVGAHAAVGQPLDRAPRPRA
jgi:hypothetical protein